MIDNLSNYLQEIDEETRLFQNEYPQRDIAFTAYIIDQIYELIGIKDFHIAYGSVKDSMQRIRGSLYGYALSENQEVLTLFYTIYESQSDGKVKTIMDATFQEAVNRLQGFYNAAIRGLKFDLEEQGQTDNPLYEPACLIYDKLKEITSVRLCIITNGLIRKYDIKNQRILGKATFTDVWDLSKIQANLSNGKDHLEIDIDFTSEFKGYKIPFIQMESDDFNYKCLMAMFPARLLYLLYERYNTDLLLNNVRYFLGFKGSKKNNANIGILKTLRTESQMFLAYNNGITAIASNVESSTLGKGTDIEENDDIISHTQFISMGVLKKIYDFSIVNGGQTTASIFNARNREKSISLYGVYVPIKILVLSNDVNEIASNITRYSNSQSKIKYADFSVSNAFNMEFEKLSRSILVPNKNNDPIYWFYERLRGQYDQEKNRNNTKESRTIFNKKYPKNMKFKKEEIAKVWKSWHQDPHDAVKGEGTNYDLYISNIVDTGFIPDVSYYKQTVALIIIYRFLMSRPENKNYGNRKASNIAYTIAFLNYVTYNKFNLYKIWEDQDLTNKLKIFLNKVIDKIDTQLTELAGDVGVLSYGKRKETFNELMRTSTFNYDIELLDDYLIKDDYEKIDEETF